MKKLTFFILSFLLTSVLQSQIHLISEKIQENIYTLYLKIPDSYKISHKDNKEILEFLRPFDESKPGFINNIAHDVFIAIPPGSNPTMKVYIKNESVLSAIPSVNPFVERGDSNDVKYFFTPDVLYIEELPLYKLNGYLWIDGQYCAHITINPYIIDYQNQSTRKIDELEIELRFESSLPVMLKSKPDKTNPIINSGLITPQKHAEWIVGDTDSWIDYNLTYIKLGVATDGIYRVDYNDFIAYGVSPSTINPKTFKLFNKGIQVPIYVDGENDNNFDLSDFIEFVGVRNMGGNHREISQYGQPYNEYLDRYSDTSIYWLTWSGSEGLRVNKAGSNSGSFSSDTLLFYNEVIHYERDNWFDFSMADLVRRESPFWYENKTWHEGNLGVGTRTNSFTVSDVYPNRTVSVYSKLQSFASNITTNAHLLAISLNNLSSQDSGYINKYQQKVLKGYYNSNFLSNGSNNIRIHSFSTNAFPNLCIFDWWEVEYPRYLKSFNDSLLFSFPYIDSIPKLYGMKITNVLANSVIVWKYGENYKRYSLNKINDEVLFLDTLSNRDKFVFIRNDKITKPKIYYVKQFTNLRSPQNQADYLAITNKVFKVTANQYINFISNHYNATTKLIDVDHIYDEFSYGYFNPEAIKSLLKATHTYWQAPVPKFVNLIGAATYDYHGNKTKFMGTPPTYNFVPSFGASISDNWFVTWDTTGAYIPQMNIGRVPVKSNSELEWYYNKHVNYVNQNYDDWNKSYLFFSGGTGISQPQLDQLREVNEFVINNYTKVPPIGGNYKHFYKTINPNTNFGPYSAEEVQNAIDNGGVFISYIGHSGTQTWDNSITSAIQLKNKRNRSPLITDFGCSTARFAEPDITSFSQSFLLSNDGQAIAYIGNSSLGFISTSVTAPKIFYKKILRDSVLTIGEVHKLSKLELLQNYGSGGVYALFCLTNSLIGDPIVKLPIPQKPNLAIQSNDVQISQTTPLDNMDSVKIRITYNNLGMVTADTFSITVTDKLNESVNASIKIQRVLPNFSDTFYVSVPIKNKPGNHTLQITLDSFNNLDEISETDNKVEVNYFVASSSLISNLISNFENEIGNELLFYNPQYKPIRDSIIVEVGEGLDFNLSQTFQKSLDTLVTRLNLSHLTSNRRYWLRAKLIDDIYYSKLESFTRSTNLGYLLNDSISFNSAIYDGVKYTSGGVVLDSLINTFNVISAGFNDGNSAVIQLNSQNFIPENTLRGHHVCLFDDSSFNFIGYKLFDVFGGGSSVVNSYIDFLDTLSNKYWVIIAVSDEGRVTSTPLKNQIKSLGSKFIDSLVFRGSWAIMGKKGTAPGSVPEAFTVPYQGRVEIDSTIRKRRNSGSLTTSTIGPAGIWSKVKVSASIRPSEEIKFRPLAIQLNGQVDSLNYLTLDGDSIGLSFIDSKKYPYLKLISEFQTAVDTGSPGLSSISVRFISPAELAMNFQTVNISRDTIYQGDSLKLDFWLQNVGDILADSVKVSVKLVKSDNVNILLMDSTDISILPNQKKYFSMRYKNYIADGKGNMAFKIEIDAEGKILENNKYNNVFVIPFYVKADTNSTSVNSTSISVKFDGSEINHWDFVSSNPKILIDFKYPVWFPITDTSAVQLFLSGKKIENSLLEINYNTSNRKVRYKYHPILEDGEHNIKIYGKNILGVLETYPGYEKYFRVTNQIKLMQVYNFPNPFKNETYFTFNLTQVPDELKIKIYTIAGRLIKEIIKSSAELSTNFNRIFWDGRDEDGDIIGNGVYLYKVIVKKDEQTFSEIQKLAIVR